MQIENGKLEKLSEGTRVHSALCPHTNRINRGHPRRRFIRSAIGLVGATLAAGLGPVHAGSAGTNVPQGAKLFAYVGSRTSKERNARGDGINVYEVDLQTGGWSHVQLVGNLLNPSFLAIDRNQNFLYTVHGDSSEISSFAIDRQTGRLTFVNQQSTEGKNPVHLALDPTNRFMVVANHITSSLVVLPVNEQDGSLGKVVDLVPLQGKIGPHRVEQPFAKPHQCEFDPAGKFIAVPDKGLDCVFTFRLDASAGKLIANDPPSVAARETSGPRHIAFHPSRPYAYVINELDSSVTAYCHDPERGTLQPLQVIPSLPDTYTGNSRASEIAVSADGRFVYASNRGYDSIVSFSVDQDTGRLSPVEWTLPQGKTPRFFALSPSASLLYAANEDSDMIVTFRVDKASGKLSPTGQTIKTGSPVCIVFAGA